MTELKVARLALRSTMLEVSQCYEVQYEGTTQDAVLRHIITVSAHLLHERGGNLAIAKS